MSEYSEENPQQGVTPLEVQRPRALIVRRRAAVEVVLNSVATARN
jgi:hypothetical protein